MGFNGLLYTMLGINGLLAFAYLFYRNRFRKDCFPKTTSAIFFWLIVTGFIQAVYEGRGWRGFVISALSFFPCYAALHAFGSEKLGETLDKLYATESKLESCREYAEQNLKQWEETRNKLFEAEQKIFELEKKNVD